MMAMTDLINNASVWMLWRVRGLHTHVSPRLANPIQRAAERAAARSPAALSILYDTDKGPKLHYYTGHYREAFAPIRTEPITLLEIGINRGGSLQMWRSYFRKARIVGIDLELPDLEIPRVEMHIGNQADPVFLASLVSRYGGFDIVIDDGSHVASHIAAAFSVLFDALRPGGWYVIEDLATSYWPSHEGGRPGTPGTGVDLARSLVDRTQPESGIHDIEELRIFDNIAFIGTSSPSDRRVYRHSCD